MPTCWCRAGDWVARGRCNHEEAIVKKMWSKENIIFFTFHEWKNGPRWLQVDFVHNLMNHFFVDVHESHLFVNISLGWKIIALVILVTRRLQHLSIQRDLDLPRPTKDASHHQDDITCSVGKPYKPLLVTVTGWGVDASNNFWVRKEMLTSWKFSDHHKIWSQKEIH